MRVRIRLFAQLSELMGGDLDEELESDRVTIAGLHRHLERTHPALAPFLPVLAVAINDEYCIDHETEIRCGDEVALIQPISGGAPVNEVPPYLVTEHPLDRDALRELVATDASGAVVLFEGVVRDHHEGRVVERLEYEAYAEMAEREIARVIAEVRAEAEADGRPLHRVAVHHRVGALAIGEPAIVAAVAAAHREEAFRAAARLVDRVKETAPIWKREWGPDGATWQEGTSPRPERSARP